MFQLRCLVKLSRKLVRFQILTSACLFFLHLLYVFQSFIPKSNKKKQKATIPLFSRSGQIVIIAGFLFRYERHCIDLGGGLYGPTFANTSLGKKKAFGSVLKMSTQMNHPSFSVVDSDPDPVGSALFSRIRIWIHIMIEKLDPEWIRVA